MCCAYLHRLVFPCLSESRLHFAAGESACSSSLFVFVHPGPPASSMCVVSPGSSLPPDAAVFSPGMNGRGSLTPAHTDTHIHIHLTPPPPQHTRTSSGWCWRFFMALLETANREVVSLFIRCYRKFGDESCLGNAYLKFIVLVRSLLHERNCFP